MTAVEDQELFSTFQSEIQKYLEDVGPLEKYKTPASLKKLLEKLRFDLVVPPWHPVTDYIRSFARACAAGVLTRDNSWCRCNQIPSGVLKEAAIGKKTWVNLRVWRTDDILGTAERYLCVDPAAGYIWDLRTECMLAGSSEYLMIDYQNDSRKGAGHPNRTSMKRATILAKAKELLDSGIFEGELNFNFKRKRSARRTKAQKPEEQPKYDDIPNPMLEIAPDVSNELEARKIKLPLFSEKNMAMLKFMHAIACKEYPTLTADFNEVYAKAEELLK